MSFERYTKIFDGYETGRTLRAHGKGAEFSFSAQQDEKRRRLFVTGETALFYQWKSEPDNPAHYHTITDALDPHHAFEAQYCLDLSSKAPEEYIRRLYKKVMWPPVLSYLKMNPVPAEWVCGIWASAKGLKFAEGGYLRMRVEIYRAHKGVNRHDVSLPPDEVLCIDFPEGDYDWTQFKRDLLLAAERDSDLGDWVSGQGTNFPASKSIAHIGVWIEGARYSGQFYIERPFLTASSGENLLPDFTQSVHDKEKFDWTAQYLSRKEWPEFRVTLNGQMVFEGEVFERCHRASEWAIDLPGELIKEQNTVCLELISDYHDPLPYILREVGVIEQPGGVVALIATDTGVAGAKAHALIRTEHENTTVRFAFPDGNLSGAAELTFAEAGLHGVAFDCGPACENALFTMQVGNCTVHGSIARIVEKAENEVLTGTGDMIYVQQRMADAEEFLSWYLSNAVGNLFTIRPTYRWSGTRLLSAQVWKTVARVLNEMGIKYAHMIDGRELPGIGTNPDGEMLAGEGFLGSQQHERDGAQFYWGQYCCESLTEEQRIDMAQRAWEEDPLHVGSTYSHHNRFYYGDSIYSQRDPHVPCDMRLAEEARVRQFALVRGDVPRHTGPAHSFKYLLKAGFSWVGAETMYGSMEPLMAFLRGANLWKGLRSAGVHHAVQWSSSPQDTPEHFRRYRLALYVSYMQGATEINTEEGLWHLEEYYSHFHRFSEGCKGHLKQQQDFYRYLSTHSRTGEFFAPMALLHGRHDGWHGFNNLQPWGWTGLPNSDAENSWGLLKVFYPLSKPGAALYIHGCDTDHPVGYHTGTPMGNIDAIPIECGADVYKRYPVLAFMGYNCADEADFDRLSAYVQGGGTLLLTRAHMTDTTAFDDILAGKLHYGENPFRFTDGEPIFRNATVGGIEVQICANALQSDEVLAVADDGTPLVVKYALGKGAVILFNANAYPAHPAIRPLYEQQLERAMRALADAQNVWAECGDDVQFTAYDQPDGSRHLYLLAVDWYRDPSFVRSCTVRAGGLRYKAHMPFGVMLKAVSDGNRIAWPHDENGEVLGLTECGARVQGTGKVAFTFAQNGEEKHIEVDFSSASVQEIAF